MWRRRRGRPRLAADGLPLASLVTVAVGEQHEATAKALEHSAPDAGFNSIFVWNSDMLQRATSSLGPEAAELFDQLYLVGRQVPLARLRPYCAAFKPLALWSAMTSRSMREGEYVAWADAPRYHTGVLKHSVRDAIAVLQGRPRQVARRRERRPRSGRREEVYRLNTSLAWQRTEWYRMHRGVGRPFPSRAIRSAYGQVHCPLDCVRCTYIANNRCHQRELPWLVAILMDTMVAYQDLIPMTFREFSDLPHLLDSNILLENTRDNRLLVWDWLWMALRRPEAFCISQVQDQAAWTVLVLNRSLPLINACMYLGRHRSHIPRPHRAGYIRDCGSYTKSTNTFLANLGQEAFEVVTPGFLDQLVPRNRSRLDCLYANFTRQFPRTGLSCRRAGKVPSDNFWID